MSIETDRRRSVSFPFVGAGRASSAVEATSWSNGEGVDIAIGRSHDDRIVSLSWEEFHALVAAGSLLLAEVRP